MMNALIEPMKASKTTLINDMMLLDGSHKKPLTYQDKYFQDASTILDYLYIALKYNHKLIFTHFMHWFGELANYLEFNHDAMKRFFSVFEQVLQQYFGDAYDLSVKPFVDEGIDNFNDGFESAINDTDEIDEFLQYLLHMKNTEATHYIQNLLHTGTDIKEIYLKILQPTMHITGELWKKRKISVAKEHYITAMVQNIIGQLYPYLFTDKQSIQYRLTAVCAGSELHEIGVRMLADFYELGGWDTHYLGSNLPISEVVQHLLESPADVLAISATTARSLDDVTELIKHVRSHPKLKHTKIMVGGKLFNDIPTLLESLDIDGYAKNAEEAFIIGSQLVST